MNLLRTQSRLAFTVVALLACVAQSAAQNKKTNWVGTWAASPVGEEVTAREPSPGNATYRNIVHLSIGGDTIRVLLTNEFGTAPLGIGAAHVALNAGEGKLQPNTDHALTFNGRSTVTIPAGAFVASDPVSLHVEPLSDLVVSTFLPDQPIEFTTCHDLGYSANFVFKGDATAAPDATNATRNDSWFFLKEIDTVATNDAAAIVTLGDSITDGARSTAGENRRWPDILAARLHADPRTENLSVLNQGIGGNRLLHDDYGPNALARFDRDVLAQAGVKYVVVLEGINDIGRFARTRKAEDKVSAEDLIFAFTQLSLRAHTHGIKIFAGTVLPYQGAKYFSPQGEQMRQAYNQWIRTSGVADGVIDFDKVTRDPEHPDTLLPAYDSGDRLHPSDAGYKAMGDAVDLALFLR
jgi:lysophospholipase L1-like esterase